MGESNSQISSSSENSTESNLADKTIIANLPFDPEENIRRFIQDDPHDIEDIKDNILDLADQLIQAVDNINLNPNREAVLDLDWDLDLEANNLELVGDHNVINMADQNFEEAVAAYRQQPPPADPNQLVQRNFMLGIADRLEALRQPPEPAEEPPQRLNLQEARQLAAGRQDGLQRQGLMTTELFPVRFSSATESGPPQAHIKAVEDYLLLHGINNFPEKVPWFKTTLAKDARLWADDREFRDWDHLKAEFVKHFDKAPCKEVALHKFRTTVWDAKETAEEYVGRLRKLARTLGYGDEEILEQFNYGLPLQVKLFFTANKPETLEAAVEKLQIYSDIQTSQVSSGMNVLCNDPFMPIQNANVAYLQQKALGECLTLMEDWKNEKQNSILKKEVSFEESNRKSRPKHRSRDRSRESSDSRSTTPEPSYDRKHQRGTKEAKALARRGARSPSPRPISPRWGNADQDRSWASNVPNPWTSAGQGPPVMADNNIPNFWAGNLPNSPGMSNNWIPMQGNAWPIAGYSFPNQNYMPYRHYGGPVNHRSNQYTNANVNPSFRNAGFGRGNGSGRGRNPPWKPGERPSCFQCGSVDHMIRNCPVRKQNTNMFPGRGNNSQSF